MKHLLNFKIFEKEEYTGKKETYRLKNVHLDGEDELVGTCKKCGEKVKVADQRHFIKCKKNNLYTGKTETYRLKDIHLDKDGELVGTCKNCEKEIKVSDQEHFIKCKKDDK